VCLLDFCKLNPSAVDHTCKDLKGFLQTGQDMHVTMVGMLTIDVRP
jgi:hypothetical protein